MASRRATRTRTGEENEGGNDVIEEEMNKWRKVAEMIGESLEFVCSMGLQERNDLLQLLPTDDDDNDKDATVDELLGTDDEDDNKKVKRTRPLDPETDEEEEPSKKAKISDQNGSNHKRFVSFSNDDENNDEAMTPQKAFHLQNQKSTATSPYFSKYVATSPSSSKLTPKNNLSPKSNFKFFPAGSQSSQVVDGSNEGSQSPIIKGRAKKEPRRSQGMFDEQQVDTNNYDQLESEKEEDIELQIGSQESLTENFDESQNLLVDDTATVIQETPDDSPLFERDNDDKNTEAINKLLDADTQEVETASEPSTSKRKLSEDFEKTNLKKMTRNAVIDKISTWKYKFGDINFLKQSVLSTEDCFDMMNMEENPEKYKFKKALTEDTLGKQVAVHLEDVKQLFSAVKHIKGQSDIHDRPGLVTVRSGKWDGGFGQVKREPKTSGSSRTQKLVKAQNYLSARGRNTRAKVKEEEEEVNIEVDDSSDDFEDTKEEASAEDSDWYPGNEKAKKGRTRNLSGEKSRHSSGEKSKHPSGGRTRKPSGEKKKLFSEAQLKERMEDSPLEEESEENGRQWLGKGANGKGRGKGTRGRGRGKTSAMGDNRGDEEISFLERGLKKSKIVLEEPEEKSAAAQSMDKEKRINDKINNTSSSARAFYGQNAGYDPLANARPIGGESSRRCYPPSSRRPSTPFADRRAEADRKAEEQSDDDDDEIEVIAEVPSPHLKNLGNGRNDLNRRHSSSSQGRHPSGEDGRRPSGEDGRRPRGEDGRRSINAESFEKLAQLGNVSLTFVEPGGSGDSSQDIKVKEKAKGECPMCAKVFWMTELEHHAAECDGETSQQQTRQQQQQQQQTKLCPICLNLTPTSTFPAHCKACRQEELERNRPRTRS